MTRVISLLALVVVGVTSIAWRASAQAQNPPTTTLDPANFTGKVTQHATTDVRLTRDSFEPGGRTNWHSHEGGQVIVIEKGRMRAFERGGSAKEFGPRETYVVAAGVTHWHGALPNEALTQVALSYGVTNWMKPVTDAEYAAAARK
jgi:quercetin dioxygenase-like cupin family protein